MASDPFFVHQPNRRLCKKLPLLEGMRADRSERGARVGRDGKVIVSHDGEIFWNGKSGFANGQHGAAGNGVIAGEKRCGMRIRSQDLFHCPVAAVRGEISLDEKGLIEESFAALRAARYPSSRRCTATYSSDA